jgi:porphobilinogen synthase
MFGTPPPGPEKFVWPIFVVEKDGGPIGAMPGQSRIPLDKLKETVGPAVETGVGGVMIFGVVEDSAKTADGEAAANSDGVTQRAAALLAEEFPDLVVFTDVCLCAYTDHGHCGIPSGNGGLDNDATLEILAETAVSHAAAGADCVAPSAMMDGQVAAIRSALDSAGHKNTLIMSYSTKFASAMYGPFREAADSAPSHGDRRAYQLPYDNPNAALLESILDEAEGADILMVKPALFYLDVIARLRDETRLPIAAYNVSGEYSMLAASAERGWGDLAAMARESLHAISRAGADIILSYWANRYDEIFTNR